MEKFQIFYKLSSKNNISLSISRIDLTSDTYKLKIISEIFDEKTFSIKKYKIKEIHLGAKEILDKIENINFDKNNSIENIGEQYIQISYGDKKIFSDNIEFVKDILDKFQFLEILNIQIEEYKNIKNVYEYIQLRKLYINRNKEIHKDISLVLNDLKEQNPYDLFENISYIKAVC